MPAHKRRGGVWSREGRLFVETYVHPSADSPVPVGQMRFFREVAADETTEGIGACVLEALEANSTAELDNPVDVPAIVHAAGLTSYETFTRGARYASFRLRDNHLLARPTDGSTRHAGSFIGTGAEVLSASLEPDAVGRSIVAALEQSIPRHR